jgi:dCMP deaminase
MKKENKKIKRPGWDRYWLGVAESISKRATCLRRKFGAVVVKDNKIIGTGYCGAPSGTPNCIDIGACLRQKYNIPSGKNYNLCRSIHAEMNAIMHSDYEKTPGSTLYLYGEDVKTKKIFPSEPCIWCKRFIINAKIKDVVIRTQDGHKKISVSTWAKEQNKDPFIDAKRELANR